MPGANRISRKGNLIWENKNSFPEWPSFFPKRPPQIPKLVASIGPHQARAPHRSGTRRRISPRRCRISPDRRRIARRRRGTSSTSTLGSPSARCGRISLRFSTGTSTTISSGSCLEFLGLGFFFFFLKLNLIRDISPIKRKTLISN